MSNRRKVYDKKSIWRKCRELVIIREGGICNRCKKRPVEEIHHIIELTEDNYTDPKIAYGLDNLEGLCSKCHNEETNPSKSIRKDIMFDDDGNVVER